MPKRKDLLIFVLKFFFSFSILAFLLIKIAPVKDILNVLKGANFFWLLLSFSLHSRASSRYLNYCITKCLIWSDIRR